MSWTQLLDSKSHNGVRSQSASAERIKDGVKEQIGKVDAAEVFLLGHHV